MDKEKTSTPEVRIIIRVDIPSASSDLAIELHAKIAELIRGVKDASVEVTLLPPIPIR